MAWAPSDRFEWTQHAQVMANYVDYDFESQMPSLRSYLYRRLVVSDSVRLHPEPPRGAQSQLPAGAG